MKYVIAVKGMGNTKHEFDSLAEAELVLLEICKRDIEEDSEFGTSRQMTMNKAKSYYEIIKL